MIIYRTWYKESLVSHIQYSAKFQSYNLLYLLYISLACLGKQHK